jgi:beta-lactam-binding protein with PASTA domain
MYSFTTFLRSKVFAKNLLYALLVIACILFAAYLWMMSYTDHGETIEIPELKGKTMNQAKEKLEALNLRIAIMDSVFDVDRPKGSILEQNPAKGAKVKENRTVYVTVNAFKAPQVTVPNLKDASLRQAKAMLEVVGLEVGYINFKPDIAKNAILAYSFNGSIGKSGMQVPYGSKIDLVVGNGLTGEEIPMPCFYGLNKREARNKLKESSLALGAEVFDKTVTDSTNARIYKQTPSYMNGAKINKGASVDLYYTEDETKIPEIPIIDTLNTQSEP